MPSGTIGLCSVTAWISHFAVSSVTRRLQIWRNPHCCANGVTLAFITNSFALIEQRVAWSARPTGLDEANVFVVRASTEPHEDLEARRTRELAALRNLSGVVDAYITNDYPCRAADGRDRSRLARIKRRPPRKRRII